MSANCLVELAGVSRYDRKSQRCVLEDVNFAITSGDRIGLVGPSGSGKTSLLRAVARLDVIDRGTVRFRGQPVQRDAVPGYRRQILYLAQRPAFIVGTVAENLQVAFQFERYADQLNRTSIAEWLEHLGKPRSLLNQQIDSLSGGERLLIALLRALSLSPLVLLMDEPTAALDAETTERFEQLVLEWQQDVPERAFVWASHDEDQVDRVTMRLTKMNAGKIR